MEVGIEVLSGIRCSGMAEGLSMDVWRESGPIGTDNGSIPPSQRRVAVHRSGAGLAELLRARPGVGPGPAEMVADEDVGVVDGLFVEDAVGDLDRGGDGAGFEAAELVFEVGAGYDDGIGLVGAEAAIVEGVG